ncbi:unnamed protein product [Boreogadus saida]
MKGTMARELAQRYEDVQQVLHTASALDARFKTLPFLSEEEREAAFQSITYEASELWDQKNDSVTNIDENITAEQTDDEPDLEPTPGTSQAQEKEYVPAQKSKAFQDLFGDTFSTAEPTQKTSRDLASAEVAKYKETAPLPLHVPAATCCCSGDELWSLKRTDKESVC